MPGVADPPDDDLAPNRPGETLRARLDGSAAAGASGRARLLIARLLGRRPVEDVWRRALAAEQCVGAALEGDRITCEAGRTTLANATRSPAVSLLWPPNEPGGYSLIVDGEATCDGDTVAIAPTRAVLHRPGPSPDPQSSCTADCIPITAPSR